MAELISSRVPMWGHCEKCRKFLADKNYFCTGHTFDVCSRCKNYGYYEVGVSETSEKLQMFCACEVGQNLKKLSLEWRFSDTKQLADTILTRLKITKSSLHDASKSGVYLDNLIKDLDELVNRLSKVIKEIK